MDHKDVEMVLSPVRFFDTTEELAKPPVCISFSADDLII